MRRPACLCDAPAMSCGRAPRSYAHCMKCGVTGAMHGGMPVVSNGMNPLMRPLPGYCVLHRTRQGGAFSGDDSCSVFMQVVRNGLNADFHRACGLGGVEVLE